MPLADLLTRHARGAGANSLNLNQACMREWRGSSTVPEMRRRGLQAALLEARMRYAFEHECNLAMMAAMPGSNAQRNVERKGFQIAYTRTKWQLTPSDWRENATEEDR